MILSWFNNTGASQHTSQHLETKESLLSFPHQTYPGAAAH